MWGISLLIEDLLASQKGLCYMELVNYFSYNDTPSWWTQSNTSNSIKKCMKWYSNNLFQIKQKQRGTIKRIKYINQLQQLTFFGLCPLSRFYKHQNVHKSHMNSVACNSEERLYAAINHKILIKDWMHLLQLNHQSQEDYSDSEYGVAASSFMMSVNCLPWDLPTTSNPTHFYYINKEKDHNSQTQQYFIKFLKYISNKYRQLYKILLCLTVMIPFLYLHTSLWDGKRTVFIWTEASRCAHKRNITLNNVLQHYYFITQGNYMGYIFRL